MPLGQGWHWDQGAAAGPWLSMRCRGSMASAQYPAAKSCLGSSAVYQGSRDALLASEGRLENERLLGLISTSSTLLLGIAMQYLTPTVWERRRQIEERLRWVWRCIVAAAPAHRSRKGGTVSMKSCVSFSF